MVLWHLYLTIYSKPISTWSHDDILTTTTCIVEGPQRGGYRHSPESTQDTQREGLTTRTSWYKGCHSLPLPQLLKETLAEVFRARLADWLRKLYARAILDSYYINPLHYTNSRTITHLIGLPSLASLLSPARLALASNAIRIVSSRYLRPDRPSHYKSHYKLLTQRCSKQLCSAGP